MLKLEMNTHCHLRAFLDQLPKVLILLATMLIWFGLLQAQSGRRSTTTPTTTAPSVSGPKPIEKPVPKPPRLQLLVGIESQMFIGTPYYLGDTVIDNCVRRLSDAADVHVTAAQKVMNRADAVRAAKEEKERFVVWLQIQSDAFNSGRQSKDGPDELYVSYIIFEPGTGKIKQSGRSHHQIYKTSRGGVSTSGRNSALYSEYALKQAARETAERVLSAFDISLRDDKIMN